jgi:hypothetical protein
MELRERAEHPLRAALPPHASAGSTVRWTGQMPVQLSMVGTLHLPPQPHRPPEVAWEAAQVAGVPGWAAAGTQPLQAGELGGLAFSAPAVPVPEVGAYERAREQRCAANRAYLAGLDVGAEQEALRRVAAVARRPPPAAAAAAVRGARRERGEEGASAQRKQRRRLAKAAAKNGKWPAAGHPLVRLSLVRLPVSRCPSPCVTASSAECSPLGCCLRQVFRRHTAAGGGRNRQDNAAPVRLVPPAAPGRLAPMFALPGACYAAPGTLAQNARFLRDGTGLAGKPRAVHTVPVPEGVVRGRGTVEALGALRAVKGPSVALLGDGLGGGGDCFYDLWLAANARSPRLLDAAYASLGLCLPCMVRPTPRAPRAPRTAYPTHA